jgi:hypothetical protein
VQSFPPYAEWSYRSAFMPESFHQGPGLQDMLKWLDQRPYMADGDAIASQEVVKQVCLAIGLGIHDLWLVQMSEPEEPDPAIPPFLLNTALNFDDVALLMEYCTKIEAAIKSSPAQVIFKSIGSLVTHYIL